MKFAFYGTMRPGQYNFDRWGLKSAGNVLGTHVVNGFKMVSVNGWYPKVYPSGYVNDTITIDIVEIEDKRICQGIHGMEIGAGYVSEPITVDGHDCLIYVADQKMPASAEKAIIPSGDWVKYNTELDNGVKASKVF